MKKKSVIAGKQIRQVMMLQGSQQLSSAQLFIVYYQI
jgi:hypothetical protein